MSGVRACIRACPADLSDFQPEFRGRFEAGGFGVRISPTTPDDERAPNREERGGVLHDHLRGRECPSRDEVHPADPRVPGLRPRVDCSRVGRPGRSDGALDERTLPRRAFYKVNPRRRKRDCERQAGKARARPKIGDRRRGPDLPELERDKRIRQVVVDHLRRVPNRGRGNGILDQEPSERFEPWHCGGVQAIASDERLDSNGERSSQRLDQPRRARSRWMYPAYRSHIVSKRRAAWPSRSGRSSRSMSGSTSFTSARPRAIHW